MGVMYFGVMRAGPTWCHHLDLDARRRSVGLGFELIGVPSLLPSWVPRCTTILELLEFTVC